MFTRSRQKRRDLGDKYLGQEYNQPEQVIPIMKNYSTRPSALPFLTYTPEKNPWAVLQVSRSIYEVHSYAKAVPADRGIG